MSFKPGIQKSQDKRARIQRQKRAATKRRKMAQLRIPSQPVPFTEKKYIDDYVTARALTAPTDSTGGEITTAVNGFLSGMSQGDGVNERDGNRIILESVEITGNVTCAAQADQTALDAPTKVYIAVVWDKQTNGAYLNSEDVFANPSSSATLAGNPLRNGLYTKRFQVLKVIEMIFESPDSSWDGTNIEQGGLMQSFKIYRKLQIPVQFVGTTNVIGSVNDNSLHVVGFCSNIALAPTLQFNSRVRYRDN